MTDTNLHLTVPGAAPNGTHANRGGGQLSREFPNKNVVWIDDELAAAIGRAAAVEKERQSVIVRRWLRLAARHAGFYGPAAA